MHEPQEDKSKIKDQSLNCSEINLINGVFVCCDTRGVQTNFGVMSCISHEIAVWEYKEIIGRRGM